MNKIRTYYDILEVEKTANQEEIKKAYTSLVLKFHPDKSTEKSAENESRFLEIDKAYKILRCMDKRKEYDAKLLQTQSLHVIIHDTVKIKDFVLDPESETRYFECKCHGFYILPEDIEESGPDVIIFCDECSLAIKVIT